MAGSFATLINDRGARWPDTWRECRVILLPKKPTWESFKDLRPITLLAITQRVFAKNLLQFLGPDPSWLCGKIGHSALGAYVHHR